MNADDYDRPYFHWAVSYFLELPYWRLASKLRQKTLTQHARQLARRLQLYVASPAGTMTVRGSTQHYLLSDGETIITTWWSHPVTGQLLFGSATTVIATSAPSENV